MRYRLIDAFTDRPFAGNPAIVVLLDTSEWPAEEWMQTLAMEFSVSETAFAHPMHSTTTADFALRWFTPLVEDELCGHATLATAHALHSDRGSAGSVRFQTRSGLLTATTDDRGAITLDLPRPKLERVDCVRGLREALRLEPELEEIYATGSLGDFLVVLENEDAVRGLDPDFPALVDIQHRSPRPDRGVIVTAPSQPGSDYDFVSRFFTPSAGIPEDPATGSAHTGLAPYWSGRLGCERLTGLQVSKRTGRVTTTLATDRVFLSGTAVTVAEGSIL